MVKRYKTYPKSDCAQGKINTVMGEFSRGQLHSGSGGFVKSRQQAIAIALSEARKKCRSKNKKSSRKTKKRK